MRSLCHAGKRTPGAFTLVEGIVAVAVVAMLAAIVLPAVNRKHERDYQAQCTTQIRELARAVLQYSQDYEGALVPVSEQQYGQKDWPDLLSPYLSSRSRFLCPSDNKSRFLSYGLNNALFVEKSAQHARWNLSTLPQPQSLVMIAESGTADDYWTPRTDAGRIPAPSASLINPAQARPRPRHLDRVTIAFMDGHVDTLRLNEFYVGQNPQDKYFVP